MTVTSIIHQLQSAAANKFRPIYLEPSLDCNLQDNMIGAHQDHGVAIAAIQYEHIV
jgi:hypothetical protein